MPENALNVCTMDVFGNDREHFWMDELGGILEKFPQLEFPHKQHFFMLIYVDAANGEIVIDNRRTRLDGAKVIIIRPFCVMHLDINRNARGKVICFTEDFFSLRYNNNILHQFSFLQRDALPYTRLSEQQRPHWETLLDLLSSEFVLQKRESRKVLRSYLNILLFELERLYQQHTPVSVKKHKHEKLQQFEVLIDQYFQTKKLPSAYADMLHLSPNYLNKICKEETGQTAGDLIRKRIIIEAQRLLYYTNYTVNEIADKLGFENAPYFVTFFKRMVNVTPEEYRKLEVDHG